MSIQIDPQLLFQRLTLVAKSIDSLEDVFQFELCSYTPALFSSAQFLREANKPVLADAIWSFQPGQGIPGLFREQLQEQLFDSYRDKSTKDMTHQRQNKGNGNLHRKHTSHHEKRSVSCKQGEQAKVHQHAQYETGREELQDVSCFRRC